MKTKSILGVMTLFLFLGFALGGYAQAKKDETIKIKTSAVCGSCKTRIEKGLSDKAGIKDVNLDVTNKIVTISYNPSKITPDQIRLEISKLGYDADNVKADKAAYDKLPACCKGDSKEKH
ncbi:MAG TPA: heavy metal-associated domain-containing protein [Bacteroidales bacterium]|nr:heavy metal-associated domain-containing protein [Bacteroidales bacterium]